MLDPGSFTDFYSELWGHEPFDWQRDLAAHVRADGWPELVDLPTGAGKTATIDIAVFLLALDADRPAAERTASRRIVTVVDRRVVVDQAADRAGRILAALRAAAPGTVLAWVAGKLRELWAAGDPSVGGHPEPFTIGVLRGGIVRDETWARRPDMPAVLASTVDQVGSRLLFRGYGISRRMAPVHAGLLGTDTLFLLDEVHLSRPFADTLRAVERHREAYELAAGASRWSVVELSATPGSGQRRVFPASPLDPASSPVLRRRLMAAKPAELRSSKGRDRLATDCVAAARELLGRDHVRALGVVVNRVRTAQQVAAALDGGAAEVVLLTGRMRPFDRDRVLDGVKIRLATGRARTGDETRMAVVATQCIEAGADFDFDGLVTEVAALSALRQRFGRVDRDGRLAEAGTPAPGVVVGSTPDIAAGDDPIYGPALAATWAALDALPAVDFGITALASTGLAADSALEPPAVTAPHLFPTHLDAWVQTSPAPRPDPDPALWLHGLERPGVPDVQIVWRADLAEDFLTGHADAAAELVAACPPGSGEAMPVPLPAVRAWLAGDAPVPVADVEGGQVLEPDPGRPTAAPRPALRWAEGEGSLLSSPDQIRPGDVLVVPAGYGGIRHGNWDPEATEPVADLGAQVQENQRGRVVLRLILHCGPTPRACRHRPPWPRTARTGRRCWDGCTPDKTRGPCAAWRTGAGQ